MLHHTTYVQRRLKLYRKNYTSYLVGVKSAVKPPATVGMAFHFDRLERLLQNEENEEGYCLRRQRVLRDRLNPLDIYDDVDLYMRFRFRRTEIMRITDILANDLRHDTDRNGALSPSLLFHLSSTQILCHRFISKSCGGLNTGTQVHCL